MKVLSDLRVKLLCAVQWTPSEQQMVPIWAGHSTNCA